MRPSPITSKAEMYRRLNAGLLGNTIPAAETFDAALAFLARNPGPYAIRYKTAGGNTVFRLSAAEAVERLRRAPPGSWNLSGMIEDDKRLCYGHLYDSAGGWDLHYSDTPGRPCKLIARLDGCEQKGKQGLAARMYLRGIMDDIGWDTLTRLVEEYPDHCIEFSVLTDSMPLTHTWSNTIFWECRVLTGEYERGSAWDV